MGDSIAQSDWEILIMKQSYVLNRPALSIALNSRVDSLSIISGLRSRECVASVTMIHHTPGDGGRGQGHTLATQSG